MKSYLKILKVFWVDFELGRLRYKSYTYTYLGSSLTILMDQNDIKTFKPVLTVQKNENIRPSWIFVFMSNKNERFESNISQYLK